MKIRYWSVILMLIMIFIITIVVLFNKRTSNICELHKELYFDSIKNGVVIDKFIDYSNHSFETIVIKDGDKTYRLLVVPDKNDKDFEFLNINDRIQKHSNSFNFTVNKSYQFELMIDCEFDII
ncbi:hypothetical protein [Algoriphagus formosus]|uniref:hypothetical protein n=1 Tax=Algoriphagus formosus TaxID=2007308 RepID=UPI003F7247CC